MTSAAGVGRTRLAGFADTRYLSLETFRRNGRGVRTPVWFAENGGMLYVRTFSKLGKVKRLRRDVSVRVAPCARTGEPLGPWKEGRARLLEASEARRADRRITRRQGWAKRLADLVYPARYGRRVLVEIELSEVGGQGEPLSERRG